MAWQDVDLVQGVWYLPGAETKNGEPLAIVLPPPAVGILQLRERERNGCPWVFPAPSKSGHVEDPRKSWARVLKTSGIQDLRPHDLRRSLGSWQTIQGASLQVVGASLGHRDLKSTQVYSRLQLDPVRESVNGWVRFSYPALFQSREVEGVELTFENGKVVKATAQKGEEFLNSVLDTDEGARYLGEFAIGTNEGIQQFTRSTLFDEKIGGTVHMAVGAGYPDTGSRNKSAVHWDMICDMRSGGAIVVDGDLFYKDGEFQV